MSVPLLWKIWVNETEIILFFNSVSRIHRGMRTQTMTIIDELISYNWKKKQQQQQQKHFFFFWRTSTVGFMRVFLIVCMIQIGFCSFDAPNDARHNALW